jgi:hypothetical protein
VSATAGVLYLIVAGLGGRLMVRGKGAQSSVDLLLCRIIAGLALFFFGFDLLGAFGLFVSGKWVTFFNAVLVIVPVATVGHIWSLLRPLAPAGQADASADRPSVPSFDRTTRLVATLLGGGFALVAALLVIGFPRGFEANAYHLPSAVNFFRDGSLRIWDTGWLHTLPANASLWDGFWLQVLPERLVSLVNLPFLGLCVLFLYRLCRYSGADRSAAGLISGGLTTIPMVGFCSAELGADVAGVTFSLAALWFALSRPQLFPSWSMLAGAASGLAYGYKPLHLVGAVFVGLLILFGRAPSMQMQPSRPTRLWQSAAFASGFLALAGIWLLRNQVQLGNPFYPIPLSGFPSLLGFTSAPDWPYDEMKYAELEWVSASWQWLVYPWVEGHKLHQNFKFSSGLGPFFAATVPIAWMLWSVMLVREPWRRSLSDGDRTMRILYICGTIVFLAWWFSGSRQPRYLMAGIAELLPLAAILLGSTSGRLRRGYEAAIGLGILFMLLVLVVNIGAEQVSLLRLGRLPTRAETFEYPPRIDDLPDGSVILDLVGRPLHYQLYGARLTNRVVSFPEAVRLFRAGDGWNLQAADLRRLGVTHAYAVGVPTLSPGCVRLEPDAQLERNPFNGKPLAEPRVLYRVIDDCPSSASRQPRFGRLVLSWADRP